MRRLYTRIYLHLLGMLLVVAVVSSLVFTLTARGAFVQGAAERTSRHAASLASEVFRDPAALARRIDKIHKELEVDLVVRDLDNRVLAVAGEEPPAFDDQELAEARAGRLIVRTGQGWAAAAPVRDPVKGTVIGLVEAGSHRRPRFTGLSRPTLLLGLAIVIFAIATVPLARRISRPVERLTEAARRLGAGDLTARVRQAPKGWWSRGADPRGDELAELTRAFNDMAERIGRLLGDQRELLANVSHELRSPLARIRVALELLPRGDDAEARIKDVEADLEDLDRLIEDVLTASRLEATGIPPRTEPVEAGGVLLAVADRARNDPRLGPSAVRLVDGPPIALTADPSLLRRALWNLVDNAAKYGVPPVTLEATREGDRVTLSVTDLGEGVPEAERERVLTPFYRLDKARTPGDKSGGFGLGLTLAKRVAEVHKGSIRIAPVEIVNGVERGCRVSLILPASA